MNTRRGPMAEQAEMERAVRGMETRAFPWYTDYQMGYEDPTWTNLPLSPNWSNGAGGAARSLQIIRLHDTIYLTVGVYSSGTAGVSGSLPLLLATIPVDYAPEFAVKFPTRLEGINHVSAPPSAAAIHPLSVVVNPDGTVMLDRVAPIACVHKIGVRTLSAAWPYNIPR